MGGAAVLRGGEPRQARPAGMRETTTPAGRLLPKCHCTTPRSSKPISHHPNRPQKVNSLWPPPEAATFVSHRLTMLLVSR
jgi:hypothetical protein